MFISLILLNRGNGWITDSNDTGCGCALRIAGEATTNVSSCSDKLVHETVTEKMAVKMFYLLFLFLSYVSTFICHQRK